MEWQIDGGQSGCFDEDKSKRVPRSSSPDVFEIFWELSIPNLSNNYCKRCFLSQNWRFPWNTVNSGFKNTPSARKNYDYTQLILISNKVGLSHISEELSLFPIILIPDGNVGDNGWFERIITKPNMIIHVLGCWLWLSPTYF